MQVRAERGELGITRETFAEHFDGWLKGHHRASKVTRDGYRASGERRLKPYFGPMRLSAIDVQVLRNFAAEMVEVEAGELAPNTVNNTFSCLGTCLKDAVALHKIPSNPCEHIAHLPGSHIERDWLRRSEIPLYLATCSELYLCDVSGHRSQVSRDIGLRLRSSASGRALCFGCASRSCGARSCAAR
jgi:Phage integrase SAM-like domain